MSKENPLSPFLNSRRYQFNAVAANPNRYSFEPPISKPAIRNLSARFQISIVQKDQVAQSLKARDRLRMLEYKTLI